MNANHALCSSPEWAQHLQEEVLPWLLRDVDLGDSLLEIGPGPGAATELLRHEVKELTAVELDPTAASALAERYAGTNVEVVVGSGAGLSYPDASFSSVGTFTMLHHVPTTAQQNQLLAEALRVLQPGGVLIGSDSLPSNDLHHFHEGDTYNPIEAGSFVARLQTIGFERVTVDAWWMLRFLAYAPGDCESECNDDEKESPR
ncbi:MAG: class I SAM-dependent methyltransferase [Acidimicrobiales bacterium]